MRYLFCLVGAMLGGLVVALGGAPGWFASGVTWLTWWVLLGYTRGR